MREGHIKKVSDHGDASGVKCVCVVLYPPVPQEALTRDGAGEALTVKEATEFADTTLQWSLWTLLEMLRSPAWVGVRGAGGAGNLLAWDKELTAAELRAAVSGWGV